MLKMMLFTFLWPRMTQKNFKWERGNEGAARTCNGTILTRDSRRLYMTMRQKDYCRSTTMFLDIGTGTKKHVKIPLLQMYRIASMECRFS
mmetsp:Transcript_19778/g.38314  ORF Transcript_19778/g.38314 Transcript_19778/m.38314 type:complete len:90 (+) Transcript_19778:776-1045(+)